MTRPGPPKQCDCPACVDKRRGEREIAGAPLPKPKACDLVTSNHTDTYLGGPPPSVRADRAVRDYFKRAGLLFEDLTDSDDIADLSQADIFCCVALVAQMLQIEERKK